MRHRTGLLLALLALLGAAILVLALQRSNEAAPPAPADGTASTLVAAGEAVLQALAARDGAALAALSHPQQGVRFSPSAFVDPEGDRVLKGPALAALFTSQETMHWGYAEGSGDPIALSGADYVAQHVPAAEALAGARVTEDGFFWSSGTVNNIAAVYPGARTLEYLLEPPGEAADRHFGTQALRLVFLEDGGRFLLVGVVSDRWSP
ncbi:MAG: hypothetical protein SNJ63_05185 [Sphingomonadaceae bacterium]